MAVWYLLMGRWTPLEEIDDALSRKVGKIVSRVGCQGLKELGKSRSQIREETFHSLKTTKIYVLDRNQKMSRRATPRKIPFLPASPSLLKNRTPLPGFIAWPSSPQSIGRLRSRPDLRSWPETALRLLPSGADPPFRQNQLETPYPKMQKQKTQKHFDKPHTCHPW